MESVSLIRNAQSKDVLEQIATARVQNWNLVTVKLLFLQQLYLVLRRRAMRCRHR